MSNTEAYNLYLHGRHAYDQFDQRGFEQALSDFHRALELDPSLASASAMLAVIYDAIGEWGIMPPAVAFEQARQAAEYALQLDPKLALAHSVLGSIHDVYDWDWAAGDREERQALALAPNDPGSLFAGARHLLIVGRWDEALSMLNASLAKDPLFPASYMQLNWVQVRRGRFGEAEAAARRALEISPTYTYAHYYLGMALLVRGAREPALSAFEQETDDGGRFGGVAMATFALGRRGDSDAALAHLLSDETESNAFGIAEVYAFRGESKQALSWLDRAYAQRDVSLYYVKGDPPLKNLEGDQRYKAFLKKMNLPE